MRASGSRKLKEADEQLAEELFKVLFVDVFICYDLEQRVQNVPYGILEALLFQCLYVYVCAYVCICMCICMYMCIYA